METTWKQKNIIGGTLLLDNEDLATITGVFKDVPDNSHLEFNMVLSWSSLVSMIGQDWDDSWLNSNMRCYVEVIPGTDSKMLEAKVTKDFDENYFKGNEVTGYYEEFFLQPLLNIHLHSNYEYDSAHGNGTAVNALLIIAAFILLISWVNQINLSTARSMERAKEVALRKVVGAQRKKHNPPILY